MVLVDTSVWIHHFRYGQSSLQKLLLENAVLCDPHIIGELACGHLKPRAEILRLLSALPRAKEVDHEEVLQFIEHHQLAGLGLGFIDMHLLASAVLTHSSLWSLDKVVVKVSQKLHRNYVIS